METGPNQGDVLNEQKYLARIREIMSDKWPDAHLDVQVGYRQGDEWFRLNGIDSEEVREAVHGIDVSSEDLY